MESYQHKGGNFFRGGGGGSGDVDVQKQATVSTNDKIYGKCAKIVC